MNEGDYLTHCPMLLSILSFLDFSDILRCKRVNRHFHAVIESSKRDLVLRPPGYLRMETLNKRTHQGKTDVALVVVRFGGNRKSCSLYITDSSVIIEKNDFLPITEYIEKNYKRIRYKWKTSKGDDQVWRYIIQENTYWDLWYPERIRARYKLFHYPEYRTKSLLDGLCSFLSLIGQAFQFDRLIINDNEFNQFYSSPSQTASFSEIERKAVMDTLLRTTTCRSLTIYPWYPELPDFYTKWGCKWLTLNANEKLDDFLPKLHLDDMFIGIYIEEEHFFESLEPVHKLLKGWQSGQFTLRWIDIGLPMGGKLSFSFADVLEAFRDLNYFSITEREQKLDPSLCMVFFIRRSIDNKTIGIKYHPGGINIRECLNGDDEEPKFNDPSRFDKAYPYEWCPRTRKYRVKVPQIENLKKTICDC